MSTLKTSCTSWQWVLINDPKVSVSENFDMAIVSNKTLIDKIFQKQRKYTKLHDKQSYIVVNNPIF